MPAIALGSNRSFRKWMGIALFFHLLAAVFSLGYNDMDEHFQILEFLAYRLGRGALTDLPYEFGARCRSFFQPGLYEGMTRIWLALGLDNPAFWAMSFRILDALVGWASLVVLCQVAAERWFRRPGLSSLSWKIAALLYYLPYVHARPSGESLGGSLFFLALGLTLLLDLEKRGRALFCGVLFGFGFLCRFQLGFAILGFGLWCLWQRMGWRKLFGLATGLLLAIGAGVLIDRHGYGEWVFSPWLYFKYAVLLGVANSTGVMPWYFYFQSLGYDVPYVGYAVGALVALAWVFEPRNPLTWSTALFFLAHCAFGHKEPRYLYPLVSSLPVLMTLGYGGLRERAGGLIAAAWYRKLLWFPLGFLLLLDLAGLVGSSLKPVTSQTQMQNFIFDHRLEIPELFYLHQNPFVTINLTMHFYMPPGLKISELHGWEEARDELFRRGGLWFTYPDRELPPESGELARDCERAYSIFPDWLRAFEFLPGIRHSASRLSLYRCRA